MLTAYQEELKKLHQGELPKQAVLNSSRELHRENLLADMLKKHKGKVVYLDVWATWCAPCIAAMRSSEKLRKKFKGQDVIFLYVCINSPNQDGWKRIIAAERLEGENYFLDVKQSAILTKTLNITTIPHYALIDKSGKIIDFKAPSPNKAIHFNR
ncbi:TlpA family protein disulfide reductase [Pedobacter endophyticus]|uniref:TlpA family protein disulfide reductase n=1 Tax=Pedobacter endophyticus TaxID=2789740 RepID=A0A7S9L154_9SPHI|nr:TlpA family protein disulfide reductase [Pedobacter endophyticus]